MIATPDPLSLQSPLVARLMERLPAIVTELLTGSVAAIPGADDLPDEYLAEYITEHGVPAIYGLIAGFAAAIDQQRPFTEAEVGSILGPVLEVQAAERISQRLLITGLFAGVRRLWRETIDLAGPDDLTDMAALSDRLLDLVTNSLLTMQDTHSNAEAKIYGGEREARRALCVALLRGSPADDLAARADIGIADNYDVVAIDLTSGDRIVPKAEYAVSRRRIRIVQQILDDVAGTSALHTFDGSTGLALLPHGSETLRSRSYGVDVDLGNLARVLTARLGVDVLVAESPSAALADVPRKAQQASDLVELARMLNRPVGVYRLDDLLLEYQLTRPGEARDRLGEQILPILDHPHLVEAVDAHIKHGHDRKSAAAEVHIHPNTFSYRLRRVHELTGIDATDPYGARLISAAMTIHRLFPTVGKDVADKPYPPATN